VIAPPNSSIVDQESDGGSAPRQRFARTTPTERQAPSIVSAEISRTAPQQLQLHRQLNRQAVATISNSTNSIAHRSDQSLDHIAAP